MKENTLFIGLADNSQLYIYKTQGLLKYADGQPDKISLPIAYTIEMANSHIPLKESIQTVSERLSLSEEDEKHLLLGITQLCVEKKLLASTLPFPPKKNVIYEDDVFYPECMHIELTKQCNFQCYYCYRESSMSASNEIISGSKLLDIIKELSLKGLKVVEITGGEPLLHPDFEKIVLGCLQELTLVSVLTNGFFINEKFIDTVLPYKDKLVFSVSFDSWRDDDLDKRAGVHGAAPRIKKAIELISRKGFIVRATMAVDENNWCDLEDTLLKAMEIGATRFAYSPIMPLGRAPKESITWDSISQKEAYAKEKYLAEKYRDFLDFTSENISKRIFSPGGCGAGHTNFVMSPNGSIRLCASYDENVGIIGNVLKQPLREVFSHPLCKSSSQLKAPSPTICGECQYTSFCSGCSLRGTIGAEKIGHAQCKWIQQKDATEWHKLLIK